jgi:hypothetical protein
VLASKGMASIRSIYGRKVVLSELADISIWAKYRHGKIVYDCIDSYFVIPRTDVKQMLRGVARLPPAGIAGYASTFPQRAHYQ